MKLMMFIFALLIANFAMNGMEITHHESPVENVLYNSDIVSCITQHLCLGRLNKYIRCDFKTLCLTNKFFYDNFCKKENKQIIIRTIMNNNYDNGTIKAATLRCHLIHKKITGSSDLSITDYNKVELLLSDFRLDCVLKVASHLNSYICEDEEMREMMLKVVQQDKILSRIGCF